MDRLNDSGSKTLQEEINKISVGEARQNNFTYIFTKLIKEFTSTKDKRKTFIQYTGWFKKKGYDVI